ncbi:MAG: nuclear transport factor 2 family protein [Acidobacteriota bacterium]|nr:nuclear transport factor 2 family protein [Acidobacteriota bacterium]
MKKILLLVGAMIVAAACGPPSNTNQVATNLNTNTAEPASPAITETDAIAKEKAIWDAIKNKDYDAFSNFLAAEQLEVLPEGVSDKAQSLAGVKQFEPSELTFSDWKFMPIDKNSFILTYSVTMKGKYKGKEFPAETARASSAWVNRAGKWEAIYHQETPVRPPMPTPTPTSSPSPATSPAASPVIAATTDDLEANERMVWDALKRRDYDAFGSFLDAAQLLVVPDGVYDKAGTLKGIQMFDPSKYELSDFKPLKFDADAGLVTYLVTVPGAKPQQERHTSIWANRGGKWRAIFHQETPARTPMASTSPSTTPSPTVK